PAARSCARWRFFSERIQRQRARATPLPYSAFWRSLAQPVREVLSVRVPFHQSSAGDKRVFLRADARSFLPVQPCALQPPHATAAPLPAPLSIRYLCDADSSAMRSHRLHLRAATTAPAPALPVESRPVPPPP